MLAHHLTTAALRVVAVLLGFNGLRLLLQILLNQPESNSAVAWFITGLYLLSALGLWVTGGWLACKLLPRNTISHAPEPLTETAAESIAITTLALYLFWQAATGMFHWAALYIGISAYAAPSDMYSNIWVELADHLFQLIASLLLLAGSRSVVRAVRWLRTAGTVAR